MPNISTSPPASHDVFTEHVRVADAKGSKAMLKASIRTITTLFFMSFQKKRH
jgi:hypothetical protein